MLINSIASYQTSGISSIKAPAKAYVPTIGDAGDQFVKTGVNTAKKPHNLRKLIAAGMMSLAVLTGCTPPVGPTPEPEPPVITGPETPPPTTPTEPTAPTTPTKPPEETVTGAQKASKNMKSIYEKLGVEITYEPSSTGATASDAVYFKEQSYVSGGSTFTETASGLTDDKTAIKTIVNSVDDIGLPADPVELKYAPLDNGGYRVIEPSGDYVDYNWSETDKGVLKDYRFKDGTPAADTLGILKNEGGVVKEYSYSDGSLVRTIENYKATFSNVFDKVAKLIKTGAESTLKAIKAIV